MTRRQTVAWTVVAVLFAAGLLVWRWRAGWDGATALAVAGLYVSVAGFALALLQIRSLVTAARAANKAVDDTLATIAAFRLTNALPTLRHELDALESAMLLPDPSEAASPALKRWRVAGLEAEHALVNRGQKKHRAVRQIRKARRAALDAKDSVYNDAAGETTLADAQREMELACDEVANAANDLLPLRELDSNG